MNFLSQTILKEIEPGKEQIDFIHKKLESFLENLKRILKKKNIKAKPLLGGSFAKGTLIKKSSYDIDIFLQYDHTYKEKNISDITFDLLKKDFKTKKIHGSRDYFHMPISKNVIFEIVPVLQTKKKIQAQNITDLSLHHVKYINKKIKNKKILQEIKITKSFLEVHGLYGAESYIGGFSGYAVELLMIHYKSFLAFLKEIVKKNKEKIIIDIEKFYPRKKNILLDLNHSKLNSPIIIIDPTSKTRNALAALTDETYERLRKIAKQFLKKPNIAFFKKRIIDLRKIKEEAEKNAHEFIVIEVKTNKQPGDIAGSKLKKFFLHLTKEFEIWFTLKEKRFIYNKEQTAKLLFVVENTKEVVREGPKTSDKKNCLAFKRKNKKNFVKRGRVYSRERKSPDPKNFLNQWKKKHKKKLEEMNITSLRISHSFKNED